MNKAIILAAGIGSRLKELTKDKPKSLIEVNNKPIIKYQIDSYLKAGISEIFIVTGYKSDLLEKFIKENYDQQIKIIYNKIFSSTNNMYSLWLCKSHVCNSDKVFISNADVVFSESIVSGMIKTNANMIASDSTQFNIESMKISVNSKCEIKDISKQISSENANACSIDLYCFNNYGINVLFDEISLIIKKDKNQWTELAIQKIIKEDKLKVIPYYLDKSENWFEIDNESDLISADILFSNLANELSSKNNFIFDLDGTIYLGNSLIDGSKELIDFLRVKQKNIYFLSNNSSKNKISYVKKLSKMGISIYEDEIILSTDAAIESLLNIGFKSGFILGNHDFKSTLKNNGITHNEVNPEFVLLAYDNELTYEKLEKASYFLNKSIPYYATHSDKFCPTENGPIPDVGSFISLFNTTVKRKPVVFGKPNKTILSKLINNKVNFSETVFVGDRLNTDFELARNCKIDFICVLSGETIRLDIEKNKNKPELIVKSVKDIMEILN